MRVKWYLPTVLAVAISMLFLPVDLVGQIPSMSPEEARVMLAEKGISEEALEKRMAEKGFDINNIKPEQMADVEKALIESIAELEAEMETDVIVEEQMADTLENVSQEAAADIERAVDQGATLSEAIPEELFTQEPELPESKIYGHHLFRNKDLSVYRQADRIKPPDNYVLGVDDELTVFINGRSVLVEEVTIDGDGRIKLTGMPSYPIRGLTIAEARNFLRQQLKARYSYTDNQFDLTVRAARTITVSFFGEVMTTGSITLSAVNTLFNGLAAARGPTDIGSVREIKLISGEEEQIFDLYQFMSDPRVARDFSLEEGDIIFIPEAQKVVSIEGAIRRPYMYELKESENLKNLIDYAGGLTNNAYLKDIQITRFSEDQRVVINVNLREILNSDGDFILRAGDQIVLRTVQEAIENFVEIRGAVLQPGQYERKDNMRLSDLMTLGVLDDDARLDFGYMLRQKDDGMYTYVRLDPQSAIDSPGSSSDLILQDQDIVNVPSLVQYSDEVSFIVTGAVRAQGRYGFDPAGILTVQDALLISGGLQPSAAEFGFIVRRSTDEPKQTQYLPFNAHNVQQDATAPDNLVLMPNDSLFIFDKADLRDELLIIVSGAVRNPGTFRYAPGMTLKEALKIAGGLTFSAASNRIDISRVLIQENLPTRTVNIATTINRDLDLEQGEDLTLMPFDQVFIRDVPQFEMQRNIHLNGEVMYPGAYSIIRDNERLGSFIRRAGGLTQQAFLGGARLLRVEDGLGVVVIDLEEALIDTNSTANLVLKDGDVISIPKMQELVTISGAVNLRDLYSDAYLASGNEIHVTYDKGKNAKFYVEEYAAGVAEDGRKRLITVVQANGHVEKTKNFLFFKVYPKVHEGARINVGRVAPKPEAEPQETQEVDWGQLVSNTLAQAVAVLTVILLVQQLN